MNRDSTTIAGDATGGGVFRNKERMLACLSGGQGGGTSGNDGLRGQNDGNKTLTFRQLISKGNAGIGGGGGIEGSGGSGGNGSLTCSHDGGVEVDYGREPSMSNNNTLGGAGGYGGGGGSGGNFAYLHAGGVSFDFGLRPGVCRLG